MNAQLSARQAVFLFAIVVFAWGVNWPVTKILVESVPPIWATALRCWIGLAVLIVLGWTRGNLVVPSRGDMPVVLSMSLLHMSAFTTLVAAALQFIPAGKAILLGYTTPLWVAVAAPVCLGERTNAMKWAGVAAGLAGLAVIFHPQSMDWSDAAFLHGCGLIMLASVCWAASIVYARAHRWIATPLQLLPWQVLIAAAVLTFAALLAEGLPAIDWSPRLALLLFYGGVISTALGFWAMSMVNRSLPALTTSLGITATPIVGIAAAAILQGERVGLSLIVAAALILGGIALSALADAAADPRSTPR